MSGFLDFGQLLFDRPRAGESQMIEPSLKRKRGEKSKRSEFVMDGDGLNEGKNPQTLPPHCQTLYTRVRVRVREREQRDLIKIIIIIIILIVLSFVMVIT